MVSLMTDEEFVLLYDFYSSKDLDFPYDVYVPFDLDEAECQRIKQIIKEIVANLVQKFLRKVSRSTRLSVAYVFSDSSARH